MRLTLVPLSHMLCNPQMLRQFYIVEIRARSILCLRNLHSENLLSSFVFLIPMVQKRTKYCSVALLLFADDILHLFCVYRAVTSSNYLV